jgi:hypothetical protein
MEDYCERYFQDFAIDSCSEQSNRIDLDGNQGQTSVWYVLAAWGEEKEWCGAEFGFADYDSTIYLFQQWGPCPSSALAIPTPGWPGPEEGIALSLPDTTWAGNFVPVYFFAGYAYEQGTIPLAANPASDFGGTANCAMPPQDWAAAVFGAMGIFEDGTAVCPGELDAGGQDAAGGDEAPEDGGTDSPAVLHVCPSGGQGVYTTITAAINAAAAGDIIELCCDEEFSGVGNRNIGFGGKDLVVRSECDAPSRCIINCEGSFAQNEARRAFVFADGDTELIRGLTIYDGRSYLEPGHE